MTTINKVLAFHADFKCLWERTTPVKDGIILLVDVSHSMTSRRSELKAAFSAMLAMDPDAPRLDLPTLEKHTRLYGCSEWAMNDVIGTDQRLVVLTDGDDTHYDDDKIKTGVDDDGAFTYTELPFEQGRADMEQYLLKRRDAILQYFELLAIDVHIIGIGNEVKDLVQKASTKKNIVAAQVADLASVKEIVAIVQTAVRQSRRKQVKAATDAGTEVPAPIIYTKEQPVVVEAQEAPDFAEAVQKVDAKAAAIAFGETLPPARIKEMIHEAEKQAGLSDGPEQLVNYRRKAALWFIELAANEPDGARIPGALLGAQYSAIFTGPDGHQDKAWFRSMNVFLSKLRDAGVLSNGKTMVERWSRKIANKDFTAPDKAAMYAVGKGVRASAVRMLLEEAEYIPQDLELILREDAPKGVKKRKVEDEAVAVPESQADADEPHPATLGIKAPRLARSASVAPSVP